MPRRKDPRYFRTWLNKRWHKVEKVEGAEYCGELCYACKDSEMRVYRGINLGGETFWALKCPKCFHKTTGIG